MVHITLMCATAYLKAQLVVRKALLVRLGTPRRPLTVHRNP